MNELAEDTTRADSVEEMDLETTRREYKKLLEQNHTLEMRLHKSEERRRAFIHILSDLNAVNRKLAYQRKAMIHILADYEQDRSRLAGQTERLQDSRRALMHILQDSHSSNLRLENSRKAMIHIMSDLRETTEAVQRREQELREKQEQLVQAGKLATLGELTTGVAHELNNPLNNIGLFVGNVIDLIELGTADTDPERMLYELNSAMQQVRKATEIISHLRTFGRAALVRFEPVSIRQVVERAISLMQEQLRLRHKVITITCTVEAEGVELRVCDTGPGIPVGLEQRIFDPFFTTKEVGAGTGLGLSITYGIIKDHQGAIMVENHPGEGAHFLIQLPQTHLD